MLEAQILGDGRRPPPPSWVKPNVLKGTGTTSKEPGAKDGHEAHHRAPPSDGGKEAVELALRLRARACGTAFDEPFAWAERWVEKVISGRVQRRHFRVAHDPCRKCRKFPAAKVSARAAPPKSRFCWGTHYLVAGWHALGLAHGRIQRLLESDYGLKLSLGEVDKRLA